LNELRHLRTFGMSFDRRLMDHGILHFSLQSVGDRTDVVENFGLKFTLLGTGEFDEGQ
jgi:hypothetical protein